MVSLPVKSDDRGWEEISACGKDYDHCEFAGSIGFPGVNSQVASESGGTMFTRYATAILVCVRWALTR